MPTVNRPVTLVLLSQTSPAAMDAIGSSWLVSLSFNGSTSALLQLGSMAYVGNETAADGSLLFAWRLVVRGSAMSKVICFLWLLLLLHGDDEGTADYEGCDDEHPECTCLTPH